MFTVAFSRGGELFASGGADAQVCAVESIKNSFDFSVAAATFCLVNTGADVEDKL